MIDYELKSEILKTDLPSQLNRLDRMNYLQAMDGVVMDEQLEEMYFKLFNKYGVKWIKEARKINNASYRRIMRLRLRIISYLQYPCVFLTLTFKDEVLNDTSEDTRRQYVRRFLKSLSTRYVANIDYGQDDRYTKREHYHAIVVGKIFKKDLQTWDDKNGYTWIETIGLSTDEIKLAKYISKLTNHAIKTSTRRHVYIYSRHNIT